MENKKIGNISGNEENFCSVNERNFETKTWLQIQCYFTFIDAK